MRDRSETAVTIKGTEICVTALVQAQLFFAVDRKALFVFPE
jgi:hypothetical protein